MCPLRKVNGNNLTSKLKKLYLWSLLLGFTHVIEEAVNKLLASWLIRSHAWTGCSKCACSIMLQYSIMYRLALNNFTIRFPFTLVWPLHSFKVCRFTSVFTMLHRTCMDVATYGKYKAGAAGGERSKPPFVIFIRIEIPYSMTSREYQTT